MDRSNRNRGGLSSRGRGGHDRGSRGTYGMRGAAVVSRGGSRGGYSGGSQSLNRDGYTSGNQGGRSGFTGTNVTNMSNNNNGTAPGRERASRWGDSNNSQITQHQPSQHQPTFVSQPPVQMPNMSNPPPGYNYGFQAQQPNNNFSGGF